MTAIWIIIAVAALAIGYAVATVTSKRNAGSRANLIIEEANREAGVIKENKLLKAKEEEMKIINDAERTANQRMQKVQTAEARADDDYVQVCAPVVEVRTFGQEECLPGVAEGGNAIWTKNSEFWPLRL